MHKVEAKSADGQAGSQQERQAGSSPSSSAATMAEVHAAWLAAGARGDVATMRRLRTQFPEWLNLQRPVGPPVSDRYQARFCSWANFHLRTIGASALQTAAWNGDLAIVQFLLESGQSPDTGNDGGMTSLMVIILRLNLVTMRCVFRGGEAVRRNIVVDCREEEDAQQKQVIAMVDLLLRLGADVNTRSQNGKTPLHYCVEEGGLLVTDLLLSRGAGIDVVDTDGTTPLTLALKRANLNVLQLFLNHHHLVATSQRHDFAEAVLLQAVDLQLEDVVHFVVDNEYASVTACNAKGETPMHRAILQHNPALMELLGNLDPEGDSLTATTTELETPVHYAARYGSARDVETLLQCLTSAFGDLQELQDLGAENPLNVVDKRGRTSLYVVGTISTSTTGDVSDGGEAGGGSSEVRDAEVQLLLSHGARLFPPGILTREFATVNAGGNSSSNIHRLVLPAQVKCCLQASLVGDEIRAREPEGEERVQVGSDDDEPMEALTELCMSWTAVVTCTGSSITLLAIVVCAGYGHEVLPLRSRGFPALLRQLGKFARHESGHALLVQLHNELSATWHEWAPLS